MVRRQEASPPQAALLGGRELRSRPSGRDGFQRPNRPAGQVAVLARIISSSQQTKLARCSPLTLLAVDVVAQGRHRGPPSLGRGEVRPATAAWELVLSEFRLRFGRSAVFSSRRLLLDNDLHTRPSPTQPSGSITRSPVSSGNSAGRQGSRCQANPAPTEARRLRAPLLDLYVYFSFLPTTQCRPPFPGRTGLQQDVRLVFRHRALCALIDDKTALRLITHDSSLCSSLALRSHADPPSTPFAARFDCLLARETPGHGAVACTL